MSEMMYVFLLVVCLLENTQSRKNFICDKID